jgi:hypothetical protein
MPPKLSTLLDLIDNGTVQLPEFQRGYVWNRDQVRGLMRSLYRRYPVGSLLLWQTRSEGVSARGSGAVPKGYVELLLDGQQRITSLYGIVRGKPPAFFEGHAEAFTGLHFHLEEEVFEFYAPAKMKGNPLWVDVTRLMQEGLDPWLEVIHASPELKPRFGEYVSRLNAICGIKELDFHSEVITGEDKTVDVVVEIFDRVNSGGTKLSKADLALAKVCAEWPDARPRLRSALARWDKAGFHFKIDWLLRVVNAVATGEALFSKLASVSVDQFAEALDRSEKILDTLLNNVSSHLGLDHDRVLAGRYGFPVMVRCLDRQGGKFADAAERDRLLYWYVHSFLWARYSGASETILNQDLEAADTAGVDRLIELLAQGRGDLVVRPADFAGGYGLGARFYPLLYMLTRVRGARDFWNGAPELKAQLLGKLSSLQVHHIFPKAKLYQHDYTRGQVNDIANFCYLTQETNLWVTNRDPAEYFAKVEDKYPGALASQWIPIDPELWQMGRYLEFLEARRVLLAEAANQFLNSLLTALPVPVEEPVSAAPVVAPEEAEADEAVAEIGALLGWMRAQGYAEPEIDVEITDPDTGESLAIAEAYWPRGLQEGLGEPVVLELELTAAFDARLQALGYRVFSSVEALRSYVELRAREVAGETEASLDGSALEGRSGARERIVTCPACGSEDGVRGAGAPVGGVLPLTCDECGHSWERSPETPCPRCGALDVEESAYEGWAYDDIEEHDKTRTLPGSPSSGATFGATSAGMSGATFPRDHARHVTRCGGLPRRRLWLPPLAGGASQRLCGETRTVARHRPTSFCTGLPAAPSRAHRLEAAAGPAST